MQMYNFKRLFIDKIFQGIYRYNSCIIYSKSSTSKTKKQKLKKKDNIWMIFYSFKIVEFLYIL